MNNWNTDAADPIKDIRKKLEEVKKTGAISMYDTIYLVNPADYENVSREAEKSGFKVIPCEIVEPGKIFMVKPDMIPAASDGLAQMEPRRPANRAERRAAKKKERKKRKA